MSRTSILLVFSAAALCPGCPVTIPCPAGEVEGPEGCVPADAGADVGGGDACGSTFYADGDDDGHGDPAVRMTACTAPTGYVETSDDCDDGDETRFTGATETCDGIDQDCDERIDEEAGTTFYADSDRDGFGDAASTRVACAMPTDFVADATDCDDTSDLRFPGNPELCDDVDNDCDDPMVDEDFACRRGTRVDCTTSCGSTGTGDCTSACGVPAAAACTAPAEACSGDDDDCDGRTDEGFGALGPRINLSAGSGRIVVVRTTSYFVVVQNRTTGITAQRFMPDGTAVGGEVTVTTTSTDYFDASAAGNRVLVAWNDNTNMYVRGYLESLTSPVTSAAIASDFLYTRVQVVAPASGTDAWLLFHDGNVGRISFIRMRFPELDMIRAAAAVTTTSRSGFDATLEQSGNRVWVAYTSTADDVGVVRIDAGGVVSPISTSLGTANPQRAPVITSTPDRVAVAWHENPASGDAVRFALLSASGTTLTAVDTVSVLTGSPPDTLADAFSITTAGGRFFASVLSGTAASSTWRLLEVTPDAPPTVIRADVETTAFANRAISVAGGADGSLMTAGTRTDGTPRAYVWGCP